MRRIRNLVTKQWILFSILSIFILVLTSGCGKKKTDEVKIGAILPLTGGAGKYGEDAKLGIEQAEEFINKIEKEIINKKLYDF